MKGNAIRIAGKLIALDDKVQLEIFSPFFDREEVKLANGNRINPQGSTSTTISRLSRGDLQALIGHVDKFTVRGEPTEIAGVELLSDGIVVGSGKLLIDQYDGNINNGTGTFQMTFIAGDRDDFMEAIRNKNLRDLELCGTIIIDQGDVSSWGDVITGDPTLSDSMLLNAKEDLKPTPGTVVYDDIFAHLGRAVHAATAEYAKDVVINGHDYFCFPTLVCFSDQTEDGFRVANLWDVGGYFRTYNYGVKYLPGGKGPITTYERVDNPIVPMFYYHQVLRHIFSEAGYNLQEDWLLNDEQFRKLCLVNTFNICRSKVIEMTNIAGLGVNEGTLYYEGDTSITPPNHMPEMSQMDFLKDFMLKFNVYFEINGLDITIVHSGLNEVQREIKVMDPNYQVKVEAKKGVRLAYDLGSDSYAAESAFTKKYTTLPDSASSAALPDGDHFIEEEYNFIRQHFSSSDVLICSNMIPYTSGDGKQYTMAMTPVNHKKLRWTVINKLDDVFSSSDQGLYPFIMEGICGVQQYTAYYEFDNEVINQLGAGSAVWRAEHTYDMVDQDITEYQEPSSIAQIGFYHGMMITGDLFIGKEYPYMSHHNYQPGAVSPKIGDWHLGIIGKEGLVETFHKDSIAMYNTGRKFYIKPNESILQAKSHRWNQSVIVRGLKLYVASIKNELPWDKYPVYECWEL